MLNKKKGIDLILKGISNPSSILPYITTRIVPDITKVKYGIGFTTAQFQTKVGVVNVTIPKNSYYSSRSPKEYEPQVVRLLQEFLNSDSQFYDIGSFFGYHIRIAQLCGVPSSQIHAFEANEANAHLLKSNFPNDAIHINNIFVGQKGEACNVVTIDDYTKNNEPPDVIKIDAEGAELDIIKSAKKTLREYSPSLLIEVHTYKTDWDDSDLISLLVSNGYNIGTVYHQMLRTDAEREINWLPEGRKEPILQENNSRGPYLLVAKI